MTAADTQFYSPGRIKILLWQYQDLVQLCRGVAAPEVETQHLPRETPEGGFEAGAAIKADIDMALAALEPLIRRVVVDYYVRGYAAVEIAAYLAGVNRWFVDRARHRGLRQMARTLHWVPKKLPPPADGTLNIDLDDDAGQGSAELHERMRMVVARAFHVCPKSGPPGYSCPVIDCAGWFDHISGEHMTELALAAAA